MYVLQERWAVDVFVFVRDIQSESETDRQADRWTHRHTDRRRQSKRDWGREYGLRNTEYGKFIGISIRTLSKGEHNVHITSYNQTDILGNRKTKIRKCITNQELWFSRRKYLNLREMNIVCSVNN